MEHFATMNEEDIKKLPSLRDADDETMAAAIFDILDSRKAMDVKVFRVAQRSDVTNYIIICGATSNTQVRSLTAEVEFKMELRGVTANHVDGHAGSSWIAMDYINVVLHIFTRDERALYNLEKLYGDAETVTFD